MSKNVKNIIHLFMLFAMACSVLASYPGGLTANANDNGNVPLAYESFDYETNLPLSGNDGGEGWNAAWTSPDTLVTRHSNPMTYPFLNNAGGIYGQ